MYIYMLYFFICIVFVLIFKHIYIMLTLRDQSFFSPWGLYNVEKVSKVNIISKIEYFMKCMKVSQSNRNRNFFILIYREE